MPIPIDPNPSLLSSVDTAPGPKQVEFDYYPVKDSGYLLHLENVIKLCVGEAGVCHLKVSFGELYSYIERYGYT